MRSTRPFASAHRSRRRKAWVSAPWSAITSPPWYAVPVSQSLTTRRTRYRGFCRTAMNSAIFAAAHESLEVPWNTARRRCAMTAILFATSFRKERLWLTTSTMPGYVRRAAATISWLSLSRWFVGWTGEADRVARGELEVDCRGEEAAAVGRRDALEAHGPRTRGARAEGEAEGARGGRRRLRRLAPHLFDPQLAGEHLLVHLAGLELLDDRELPLQLLLVSVCLGLPRAGDCVALHPVVRVIADVL